MGPLARENASTRGLLIAYWVASLVNIAGEATGINAMAMIAKPFIMFLLFIWTLQVLPRPNPRAGKLLVVGIAFAWMGDVLLMVDGDLFFLLGIAGFFGMQVFYIWAFLTIRGEHLLRRRPAALIPFAAYWILMNAIMSPGALRVPVLLYSIVLVGMSATALDLIPRLPRPLGWQLFGGSVLFVISDSLIAVKAFGSLEIGNWQGVAVMVTYVIAQFLIVTRFTRSMVAMADLPRNVGA